LSKLLIIDGTHIDINMLASENRDLPDMTESCGENWKLNAEWRITHLLRGKNQLILHLSYPNVPLPIRSFIIRWSFRHGSVRYAAY